MPYETPRVRSVVLLCSDLMISSSLSSAAAQSGLRLKTVTTSDDLRKTVSDDDLVCIDLAAPGLDIKSAAGVLSENVRKRAVVYGPHVQTAHFEAARAAGFSTVIARGQFAASVMQRVAEFAAS